MYRQRGNTNGNSQAGKPSKVAQANRIARAIKARIDAGESVDFESYEGLRDPQIKSMVLALLENG